MKSHSSHDFHGWTAPFWNDDFLPMLMAPLTAPQAV